MSSRRLPGKVLRPLAGRPALEYVLEELDQCRSLERVLVATSTQAEDDAIVDFCAARDVECRRGPLDDVAGRLAEAAEAAGLDAFVRVSGDSPLLDFRLVDEGVGLFSAGGHDLVTNVFPRTYPHGQSVEVVAAEALAEARATFADDDEREHVTLAFYRRPERYRIHNFAAEADESEARLVLDTAGDEIALERLITGLDRPHWAYRWHELLERSRQPV